jgi:hypothetical protein
MFRIMLRIISSKDLLLEVIRTSLKSANSTKSKSQMLIISKKVRLIKSKNDNKCHRCGTYSHFAKDCHTPKHLVALYQKSLKEAKQGKAKEPRYEAHFNLASEATKKVGCSSKAIVEAKNNNVHQVENLPRKDDMIVEFTSNDMFGDFT